MRVRNLDNNKDWHFGNSQINYVREQKAIELDIQMRLYEWFNDCFFALQKGIDWKTRLGAHNQKQLLDNDIQEVILSVDGVVSVQNIEVELLYEDKQQFFSINALIVTQDDEQIIYNGLVPIIGV